MFKSGHAHQTIRRNAAKRRILSKTHRTIVRITSAVTNFALVGGRPAYQRFADLTADTSQYSQAMTSPGYAMERRAAKLRRELGGASLTALPRIET